MPAHLESPQLRSESNLLPDATTYRGKRVPCAMKSPKSCKRATKKCSYRKGVYTKKGTMKRRPSCASKKKKMRSPKSLKKRTKSTKKSKKTKSGKKKKMRSPKKKSPIAACAAAGMTWVSGKRGVRKGYCRKSSKKTTKKKMRSPKNMCNMLSSGKKRSKKSCKRSKKCSWKSGKRGVRKGSCAKKSKKKKMRSPKKSK